MKNSPHVVILDAGASVSAISCDDENPINTPLLNGFLKKIWLSDSISDIGLKTANNTLEDIYTQLAARNEYAEIRNELDETIRKYFASFTIPDKVTTYDLLILSLRKKDLLATFDWDPLLLQAHQRVSKITDDIPDLAFLHGNVVAECCPNHKYGGLIESACSECNKPFTKHILFYPGKQKEDYADPFTFDHYKVLKNYLQKAYLISIFACDVTKSDVEGLEFIDVRPDAAWKKYVHPYHYRAYSGFFNSCLAKHPRRTTEAFFDRTENCIYSDPATPFSETMDFTELKTLVGKLVLEEKRHRESYLTVA